MTREEILRMVEAVEAELGDGSTDHYPAPKTITEGQLRELCRAVQQLVARLEKLEAVAEAAPGYLHDIDAPVLNEPTIYQYEPGEDKSSRLSKALTLLEEVEGGQ